MLKVPAIHTGWRGLFAYGRIKSERMKKLKIFLKKLLTKRGLLDIIIKHCSSATNKYGGIAQLARALGSYPGCRWFKSDCRYHFYGPLVKRLRHRPFTAESWVRFPYGSPQSLADFSARLLFYVYCRFCLLKRMAVFRKSCKALRFNLRNNLLLCKNPPTLKVSGF